MNDIKKLTEYYRQPDGRVYYKEFVASMEHAFNIPELEKKPLNQVTRPGRGLLSKVKKSKEINRLSVCNSIVFLSHWIRI